MRIAAREMPGRPTGHDVAMLLTILLCLIGLGRIVAGTIVPAKAVIAQVLLERAFARSLASHRPERPWAWADMTPVARISVPRLGVVRIVLGGGSGQAMAFGPTVLPGGARLGGPGTVVLAAHRDTHFRFLRQVRIGDRITLEDIGGVTRDYRVERAEIVRWDRFAIGPDKQTDRLVLATCYPFGASSHGPLRYVVHAVAVPRPDAARSSEA